MSVDDDCLWQHCLFLRSSSSCFTIISAVMLDSTCGGEIMFAHNRDNARRPTLFLSASFTSVYYKRGLLSERFARVVKLTRFFATLAKIYREVSSSDHYKATIYIFFVLFQLRFSILNYNFFIFFNVFFELSTERGL